MTKISLISEIRETFGMLCQIVFISVKNSDSQECTVGLDFSSKKKIREKKSHKKLIGVHILLDHRKPQRISFQKILIIVYSTMAIKAAVASIYTYQVNSDIKLY